MALEISLSKTKFEMMDEYMRNQFEVCNRRITQLTGAAPETGELSDMVLIVQTS